MALLVPHVVLALIFGPTREILNPVAMLVVIPPVAFIPRVLLGGVNAKAICLVVDPIAVVNVTTGMVKFSASTRLVVLP